MCCPLRVRASTLRATLAFLALCTAAACSGGEPEAGGNAPFAIEVSQTYIRVENRTGEPLVGGEISIIPAGILPPFKTALPRLETGGKRDILLNAFRGNDGTPFNRNVTRGRRVRITAKDLAGNVYQAEVPFN